MKNKDKKLIAFVLIVFAACLMMLAIAQGKDTRADVKLKGAELIFIDAEKSIERSQELLDEAKIYCN